MAGTLYLIATPIGNLEDITLRALRMLKQVDLIACEDTRHSRKLLEHYGIAKPVASYHEHSETRRSAELVERLEAGANIALISDAGTPLISDPGYRLVSRALERGLAVIPVPGPSAMLAALTASGLPTDSFYFGGFFAPKPVQRRKQLAAVRTLDCTLVFYEAPHRILESLEDVEALVGPRPLVLTRELTKMHEEFLRGTPVQLIEELRRRPVIKGEITLVIGKPIPPAAPADAAISEAVGALVREGLTRMEAMKRVARDHGLSKRQVYDAVERQR
ncbi:MAG: 16S rRNA (cytidine(1402)-2'-O)-methyltransferase [Acidobacteria bacterium]|nr:16S rRNA (cytidine(1402)-2'-O)-methyltransferase [Acidobacteriota bacterium]